MMNPSPSNPSHVVDVGPHIIGANIVTVKMSGKNKYDLWRLQMECLLKSQQMVGFIDGQFPFPGPGSGKGKVGDTEAWVASDSLVKGWILGSLSEEVARKSVNRLSPKHKNTNFTAKEVWDELQRSYGPSVIEVISVSSEDAKSKHKPKEQKTKEDKIWKKASNKRSLYKYLLDGNTNMVIPQLEEVGLTPWDKLMNNGNTALHVAVGSSTKNPDLLQKLLEMTPTENTLLDLVNSDGSSLLHVAAIGGNIKAVNMLVERNPDLLLAQDSVGHTPLAVSISNMQIKTSRCLFEHVNQNGYDDLFSGKSGEDLVVFAIAGQDFSLAKMIIDNYNAIVDDSDTVLTALAQNFPREPKFWERKGFGETERRLYPYYDRLEEFSDSTCWQWLLWTFYIILFTVRPFVQDTFKIYEDATDLLVSVCREIIFKDSGTYHEYYTNSIFEATRRNASTFIRCIMWHFPDAIWSTNEDGHNFIQYSVINRSEKIYNLLHEISEQKNIFKTIKDFSGNNLLHLVSRLAPTNRLNLVSGAALKLQREQQWFKEVERFVLPLNRMQKNSYDETPQMVFTREHEYLVIEGENWIKKTVESYSITTALIITVVFAAAITVPGGNNQESGIPVFTNNSAFIVFAISDAISLFSAVTSLLMFLSILTARFAEQDFLIKLPTKLIIGLAMLFLSTTAMIIAFGATLFLVFGQRNLLMFILIGALTCLPITSFVTLQYPLIVELISDTYGGGKFGSRRV